MHVKDVKWLIIIKHVLNHFHHLWYLLFLCLSISTVCPWRNLMQLLGSKDQIMFL